MAHCYVIYKFYIRNILTSLFLLLSEYLAVYHVTWNIILNVWVFLKGSKKTNQNALNQKYYWFSENSEIIFEI